MGVTCWCESKVKDVHIDEIMRGLTLPCDKPMCQAIDNARRSAQ